MRSLFAREHYTQMDAAMEAKDRELAAAREEIAMLKKALQGKGKTSAVTSTIKKTPTQVRTKANKENAAPRTPSKSVHCPVSVSPLRKAVAVMNMPQELPQPSTSPSRIPTLARPPRARLPR